MELRRFSPDSVIVHPSDVCCRLDIRLKNQQKARNMCKPLINNVCSVFLEQLEKEEVGFSLGAPWPSVVEQSVKQKPEMDLAELPNTALLEQGSNLMRELKQQGVCDMEFGQVEVMWQEADASLWSTLAHEQKTVAEICQVMNVVMNLKVKDTDRWRMKSSVVAEQEGHSKQDPERVKKALTKKIHTNLGHPGEKEMVRVLKHGRASELAIQKA